MESLPAAHDPIPVPCLKPNEVPKIPVTAMNPKGTALQMTNQADADLADLNAYVIDADAKLRGCSMLPQPKGDTK